MPWAELTDCRCFYDLDGIGEPLLLIPGLGGTGRDWEPAVGPLSPYFSMIRPDLRGVGRTTMRRTPQTLHHYAADLVELLDHLQVERTHVIGLSLGGILAQRLAMDYPDRIKRLVLISCGDHFGPYLREMAQLIGHAMRRFPRDVFERTMELLGAGPMYLDENPQRLEEKVAAARAEPVSRRAVAQQLRALGASNPTDREFERIVAPTLVIAGEFDTIIPYCYAKRMAERLSNSRFILLDGAGHNPLIECPHRVLGPTLKFLKACDSAHDPEHGSCAA